MEPTTEIPSPSNDAPVARRVFRVLFALACVLLVAHGVFRLSWDIRNSSSKFLRTFFDMGSEFGVLTWLSITTFSMLGSTALALGSLTRRKGWYGVGALFLFCSLDDATMFHERFSWETGAAAHVEGVYVWMVVLGPIFLVSGLAALAFLWRRLGQDPGGRAKVLFGFGALGVALSIEAMERQLVASGANWRGFPVAEYSTAIEEFFEVVGPLILLYAVGARLERECRSRIESAPSAPSARPLPSLVRRRRAG